MSQEQQQQQQPQAQEQKLDVASMDHKQRNEHMGRLAVQAGDLSYKAKLIEAQIASIHQAMHNFNQECASNPVKEEVKNG